MLAEENRRGCQDDFPASGEAKRVYTEAMKQYLTEQRNRYPLMNEEDVVKFAFQGMLGVGHLVNSEEAARRYLEAEMAELRPDAEEPLTERISPEWLRLNLRPAMAGGMGAAEIAGLLFRSAREEPLPFTRKDVYDFCMALDSSEKMKAAAETVLVEDRLPRHSQQYRDAYRPAYRVLREIHMKECP